MASGLFLSALCEQFGVVAVFRFLSSRSCGGTEAGEKTHVVVKSVGAEHESAQRHVGRVHGLDEQRSKNKNETSGVNATAGRGTAKAPAMRSIEGYDGGQAVCRRILYLEGDALFIAVEVALRHEVPNRLHDLLQQNALRKTSLWGAGARGGVTQTSARRNITIDGHCGFSVGHELIRTH